MMMQTAPDNPVSSPYLALMRVSRNAALLRSCIGHEMKHHGAGDGMCTLLFATQQLEQEIECYLKYDPNQPRVPAGSADGGQWTSGGGGESNVDADARASGSYTQEILAHVKVPNPSGDIWNRSTIFIGGGSDSRFHNVRDSDSLNKDVYDNNYYSSWLGKDKISAQIAALPPGQKINLVGHSYGADTAAEFVIKNPGRINMLVTVDPVSIIKPDFAAVRRGVTTWINIDAVGKPGNTFLDDLGNGNMVAGIGGAWNERPVRFATISAAVQLNHGNFDAAMKYPISGGKNAEQLLNGE